MANGNFIVQNGLQVGPLTIDASTGSISTTGTVSVGGVSVSEISKNDSKISINDTGSGSNVSITIDGTTETTIDAAGLKLPSGDAYYISGTSVLDATTLGSGVVNSSLTGVGNLTSGTWSATTIGTTKGGTGLTSFTSGGALYATSTSALTTGTLPVASGGTGVTTSTGSGSVVLSASPTFTGTLAAATINAAAIGNTGATLTGTIQTAAQTNITSVGTLTGLTLSGTLTGTTINAATIGNSGATLTGTLSTAAQTNITSVGTLTGLTLSGTLNGTTLQAATIGNSGAALTGATLTTTGAINAAGTATVNALTSNGAISGTTGTFTGAVGGTSTANFAGTVTVASLAANADIVVGGNLTVNGTTTTMNTDTVTVEDKNITLGNVATPTDVTADGGGITLLGATNKTFNWVSASSAWTSSEDINVATGKGYEVNGTSVLNATTLGSSVVNSSLTSVGTIATGTWNATTIATTKGGTGLTSFTSGGALYATSTSALTTGTLPVASGGTGVTTSTGTGSVVLSASPTFTGTLAAATINAATIGNTGATLTGTLQTAAQTNVTSVGVLTGLTVSGAINSGTSVTAPYFTSNVATGTAPLTVTSTTLVSNLNADLWDGNHFASYLNQAVLTTSSPTFAGITLPSITKSGTSGTGDIGSSSNYFGTVYGKATTAQYADLAENYSADAEYEPGTVVCFGGEAEVTLCDADHCRKIAGVVSTNPAYLMNGMLEGVKAAVALQGRVPCKVIGPVQKGDMMVSAGNGRARAEADPKTGAVIGKALENFDGIEGVIEVVIGRV